MPQITSIVLSYSIVKPDFLLRSLRFLPIACRSLRTIDRLRSCLLVLMCDFVIDDDISHEAHTHIMQHYLPANWTILVRKLIKSQMEELCSVKSKQ